MFKILCYSQLTNSGANRDQQSHAEVSEVLNDIFGKFVAAELLSINKQVLTDTWDTVDS